MKTSVRNAIVAGLLIREAFSFWTGHPYDFELWVRTGYWVARGMDPYGIIPPAPGVSFVSDLSAGGNPTVAYLPFWPLLLGGIYLLYAALGSPTPLLYYFLIKQPIILGDVAFAYLLYRFVWKRAPGKAFLVTNLWLFSPFSIVLSGIWGMFDSLAMVFVILALEAAAGGFRAAWDGAATFVKSIPVIFAITLSFGPRGLRNLAISVGIPAGLTLLTIVAAGWTPQVVTTTLESTVAKGGLSLSPAEILFYLNSLGVTRDFPAAEYFYGYAWIPACVVAALAAHRWFGSDTERGLVQSLLLVTLTFLLVRGQVQVQYSIYLLGLMLIDVALWSPRRMRLYLAYLTVVFLATIVNDVLLIRFLAPVAPWALPLEASIIQEINPYRDAGLLVLAVSFVVLNLTYLAGLVGERRSVRGTAG